MTKELEILRRALKDALPRHIGDAVARYDGFVAQEPGETAKDFAAHNAACKQALSHVELLVKLLRWAAGEDRPDEARPGEAAIGETELLRQARLALEAEPVEGDDEEEGDGDGDDLP